MLDIYCPIWNYMNNGSHNLVVDISAIDILPSITAVSIYSSSNVDKSSKTVTQVLF